MILRGGGTAANHFQNQSEMDLKPSSKDGFLLQGAQGMKRVCLQLNSDQSGFFPRNKIKF
jgi:hypothetical protein